jgi:hypothetical protein
MPFPAWSATSVETTPVPDTEWRSPEAHGLCVNRSARVACVTDDIASRNGLGSGDVPASLLLDSCPGGANVRCRATRPLTAHANLLSVLRT